MFCGRGMQAQIFSFCQMACMWACAIHSMENVQTLSLQNQYWYWLHNYTPDREKMLLIIVLNVLHSEYEILTASS